MTVRAKFKVTGIDRTKSMKRNPDGSYSPAEVRTVRFAPVYGEGGPDEENRKFWDATPSGEIKLGCANLEAAEQFELDQEFYVDFTPAS